LLGGLLVLVGCLAFAAGGGGHGENPPVPKAAVSAAANPFAAATPFSPGRRLDALAKRDTAVKHDAPVKRDSQVKGGPSQLASAVCTVQAPCTCQCHACPCRDKVATTPAPAHVTAATPDRPAAFEGAPPAHASPRYIRPNPASLDQWHDTAFPGYQVYGHVDPNDGQIVVADPPRWRRTTSAGKTIRCTPSGCYRQ
jgi:hypothetical protein